MTIKGDMVATLVSRGKSWEEARELVQAVLECAKGPDFAIRYARENPEPISPRVSEYWNVIAFLKSMV